MWYRKSFGLCLGLVASMLISAVPLLGNSPPELSSGFVNGTMNLTMREMDYRFLTVDAKDPDNDPLTYTFGIVQDPTGGKAKFYPIWSDTHQIGFGVYKASVYPGTNTNLGISDYEGQTVVVACDVSDGQNVTTATFNITIQGYNRPPIFKINGTFGSEKDRITAGGYVGFQSESYDPDTGQQPSHQWFVGPTRKGFYCPGTHIVGRKTDSPSVNYAIPNIPLTYPEVDQIFRLELKDHLWHVSEEVTVYLKPAPDGCGTASSPITVSAGLSQCAVFGQTVTLDGYASGGSGTLTYSWQQLSATTGSAVKLSNANVLKPTFVAPSTTQFLTFRLTVSDGATTASADTTVSVQSQCDGSQPPPSTGELEPYGTCVGDNQPAIPTITSAPSQVNGDEVVQLTGKAEDPDNTNTGCSHLWQPGVTAILMWEVADDQGLDIHLSQQSGNSTSFTAPIVEQDKTIQIAAIAVDCQGCGNRIRTSITIKSQTQQNPHAAKIRYSLDGQSLVDADPASPVMITAPKEINLSAQIEGFNSPVYAWSKSGAGSHTLNPVNSATSKFGITSFPGTSHVDVTITLNVKESTDASKTASATMVIRILPSTAAAPVAKILSMTPAADVQAGDVISLVGKGTRSDGEPGDFQYKWSATCLADTAVTVFAHGDKALVVAPPPTNGEAMEVITVKLSVSENGIDSTEPDVVKVKVLAPTLYYAQLAVGQLDPETETRVETQLMLVNDSDTRAEGTLIEFFDSEGNPMKLMVDGELQDRVIISLPERSARQLLFTEEEVKIGWAQVKSSQKLTGLALFRYLRGDELLGEAALFSSAPGKRFTTVAAPGRNLGIGLALANPSEAEVKFKLVLTDEQGQKIVTEEILLEPFEHVAKYIWEDDEKGVPMGWFSQELDSFGGGTLTVEVQEGNSLIATVIKARGLQISAIPLASRMD